MTQASPFHKIKFCKLPMINAAAIIIPTALSVSLALSSRVSITKVATQGNIMARTVLLITSCLALNAKGANMPIATSLRRKPTDRATTVSLGSPHSLVSIGLAILAMTSKAPKI